MRILIADDDKVTRLLVSAALGEGGHEVVPAEDGEAAWKILQAPNAPQLAVLDWMMPKMDGLEVVRKVRSSSLAQPTHMILLTSRNTREDIVRGLEAGADDYLAKPFDPDELRARVRVGARILQLQSALARRVSELQRAATARQQAEEALVKEQYYLHSLLNYLPDAIYFKDASSRFVRVSREQARRLGLRDPDEAVGKNDHDFFTVEHASQALEDERQIMRTREPVVGKEEKETWPDGSVTWVTSTKVPLLEPDGKVVGTFGVSRDITERKRAEAEHVLLTTAAEQAADAIIITDAEGRIQYINPAFTTMTGYSGNEAIGQNPRLLKSGTQNPEYYRELWKAILDGQTWHGQLTNRRKDGTLYIEEMTITPVRDSSGVITNFIAVKHDVTERKRAEEALHESEQRYRLLFSEMGVGFALHELICDKDGKPADYRFLAVNTAFEELTGLRSDRITGKTVREVLPDLEPLWIEKYGKVALNGESAHFESFAQPLQKYFEINAFCPRRGQFAVTFSDITGRKQAEEAKSLLASIVEFSDDAIIGKDLGGTIVSWNRAAELLYSYRADEVTGRSVSILAPPGRPDEIPSILEKIRRGERISHFDTVRIRKDGSPVDVSLTISPIKNGAGEVTGAATIARDITELKRAEETLREREEKYRSLVANIPDVAWTVDSKGRFAFMSPNIQRVSGYTADEVYQRGADLLFKSLHPDDAEKVEKAFESLFTRGEAYNVEYRIRRKTGEWIWANDRAVASYEKNGTRYADGLLSDITARKRAEAALRASESRYRLLFETNIAATIRATIDGRIVDCNGPAAHLLGYESPNELVGLSMRDIYWDPEKRVELIARLQAGEAVVGAEVKLRHKDGRPIWLILNLSVTPADDAGETLVQGTLVDITERKRAEEALAGERNLLRALIDNTPDLVFVKDRQSRFVVANTAVARAFGIEKPEQVIGKTDFDFSPSSLAARYEADDQALMESGEALISREEPGPDPSGAPRWLSTTKVPLRSSEGKVVGLVAVCRDITERKRAEADLHQSRQMLQFVLDNIPQKVFWKDRNLTYLGCNQALAIDAGLRDPKEIVGKNDFDLAWRGVAELYRADDTLVMEQEAPKLNFEEQLSRADGSLFWVRTCKLPLRDREGRVTGVIGTYEDITERKRTEEALAEAAKLTTLRAAVGVALTRGGTLRAGLQECAEALVRHIDAAFARIWTLNEGSVTLMLEASAGLYTHIDGPHARVRVGSFKIGRIAESQTPHLSNDVQSDPEVGDHEWAKREGLVSLVGHPLLVENKLVGVVAAFGRQPFSEATLLAFASVANQIARFVHAKRAEAALQRSEAYLAAGQRLSHTGSWALNCLSNELYWSQETYRIFGVDPATTQGSLAEMFLSRIHSGDRPRIEAGLKGVAIQKESYAVDYRIVLPGGSVKHIRDLVYPVADDSGEVIERYGVAMDVTERKQAEARLTVQYQTARALAECGTLAEAVPRVLQALCELLGWDYGIYWDREANLLRWAGSWHSPSLDLTNLEDVARQVTFSRGLGMCGRVWASGEALWFSDLARQTLEWSEALERYGLRSAVAFPIAAGAKVLSVMQLFSREILPMDQAVLDLLMTVGAQIGPLIESQRAQDERSQAEQALHRSEERAQLLFAAIPHPSWVTDLETLDFLEVNDAAVEHYGYSRDEFLHMKITDIRPAEEVGPLQEFLGQAASPKRVSGGWKHRTKGGRIIDVEISRHTLEYDGRRASLIVAQDVTERKQLELELRHSQKLEAVGSLAAGIAHELNTPIQFVGDNTHFLQDAFRDLDRVLEKYRQVRTAAVSGAVTPALLEAVAQVEAAADLDYLQQEIPKALDQSLDGVTRVARIVRAMKEFAHPDRSEKMATDINKSLDSTLIVARNEIKYVADTETDFGELPLVLCHGGDINSVFLNLLVNAAHAIKDVVKDSGNKGLIRILTRLEGEEVLISIADTGSGIPENIRDKIFEPFFTTKGVGRGTGQGLAIARSIVVEKHGGSLTFDTQVGQGTTFHIRLPIDPDAARTGGAA